MGFGLFGPKVQFFEMFKEQSENLFRASAILHKIYAAEKPELADPLWAKDIIELEVEGDNLAKKIHETRVFIVPRPFEREDVYELVKGIDDVIDFIEEAVKKLVKYRVIADPTLNEMILVVRESLDCVNQGVACLRKIEDGRLDKLAERMIDCEHRADRLEDKMIDDSYEMDIEKIINKGHDESLTVRECQLVEDAKNFKRKRRELAEIFEKAVDACRHIFHILGNIKRKNS